MRLFIAAVALVALAGGPSGVRVPLAHTHAGAFATSPGGEASIERRYRMAAKVRPLLLFWITRENVGGARIVWRRGEDGTRGWELLIGSDPLRAPMKINRWGYVREDVQPSGASMLGVMKQSDEESIAQAQSRVQNESREGYPFKMIRARMAAGTASSTTSSATFRQDFTYRDLAPLLESLHGPSVRTSAPKELRVPAGVKAGLLVAIADLLHDSVDAYRRSGNRGLSRRAASYVYNGTLYDLSLAAPDVQTNARYGERTYAKLLEGAFEIRNKTTGSRESFGIVYGVEGALSEVPVCITYQPRWWFKAELVLDDRETF